MSDILIHKILERMNAFSSLNLLDEPTWIFKDEYKGDIQLLLSSLQYILDEELAYGFEILDYVQNKGLQIDIKNLVVTESGKKIATKSKFKIRGKALVNKAVDKIFEMQDNTYTAMDKYETYSDEKLLRMVRSNNFLNASHRTIVVNILKQRGYTKEDITNQ